MRRQSPRPSIWARRHHGFVCGRRPRRRRHNGWVGANTDVEDRRGEPWRFRKLHRKVARVVSLAFCGRHHEGTTRSVNTLVFELIDEPLQRL
jgi:hypothetical protein